MVVIKLGPWSHAAKVFLSTRGFIQRMGNGHRFAGCKKDIRHGLGISVDENLRR